MRINKSLILLAAFFMGVALAGVPASASTSAAAPIDSLTIGKINYNAYGSDTFANRNREFVEITNTTDVAVKVDGLLVQDAWARGNDKTSGCNTYKLEAGKLPVAADADANMLPAKATLRVYMGAGTDEVEGTVHKVYRNMPKYCGWEGHVLNNSGKNPFAKWDTVWVTLDGASKAKGYNFYFGYYVS
jgi:streptogramin lyase